MVRPRTILRRRRRSGRLAGTGNERWAQRTLLNVRAPIAVIGQNIGRLGTRRYVQRLHPELGVHDCRSSATHPIDLADLDAASMHLPGAAPLADGPNRHAGNA